ncbi:MAG: BlaI/MecI/CopY family transcriptional regulator [Planctomycetota bacterium]
MAKRAVLSKSEMEIAQVLWKLGEASAREVTEALPKSRKLDFSTVQTYLSRLENKRYVRSKLVGRAKVYRSSVKPQQVVREAVDDFVKLLFGGEKIPLVRHLVSDTDVSKEDLAELRALLEKMEAESDAE